MRVRWQEKLGELLCLLENGKVNLSKHAKELRIGLLEPDFELIQSPYRLDIGASKIVFTSKLFETVRNWSSRFVQSSNGLVLADSA